MQPVKSCLHCQFLRHVLKAFKLSLKLSCFCKKMQNFRALGAPPPDPPKQPPHCEFLATRLLVRYASKIELKYGMVQGT